MNYRALLILSLSLGLAAPAFAKPAPLTITVVGDTKATILVDGKPYVPGTPLPRHATISVSGAATLKLGDRTIATDGAAKMGITVDGVVMIEGSATVAVGDRTTTLHQGQTVLVASAVGGDRSLRVGQTFETTFGVSSTLIALLPPPPSPKQNTTVAPVSPSSP